MLKWNLFIGTVEETFGQGFDISDGDSKHKGADGEVSRYGEGKVIEVESFEGCGDVCIWSNLPIMAGLYDAGQKGVYFEVQIQKMKVHSPT